MNKIKFKNLFLLILVCIIFFGVNKTIPNIWKIITGYNSEKLNSIYNIMVCVSNCFTIPIFGYWLYKSRFKIKENQIKVSIVEIIIITFGILGITQMWHFIVQNFLSDLPLIKNSLINLKNNSSTFNNGIFLEFLSIGLLTGIYEEIIFRGLIFGYLDRINSGWFAIIVSALLFGIAHIEPIQVGYTFIMGIIFGIIFNSTRNIYLVMFIHILNNSISILSEYLKNDLINNFLYFSSLICIIPMIYIITKKFIIKNRP